MATLTAILMYFVQHKGWLYSRSAHALLAAMLAVVAAEMNTVNRWLPYAEVRRPGRRFRRRARNRLALTVRPLFRWRWRGRPAPKWEPPSSPTASGDSVLWSRQDHVALPTRGPAGSPPGSRFIFSFPIPMLYYGVKPAAGQPFDYRLADSGQREAEARFRAEMDDDIKSRRPALVVVSTSCGWCPDGFSLRDYLSETGFLQQSMKDYREGERFDSALVYVRQGNSERPLRP